MVSLEIPNLSFAKSMLFVFLALRAEIEPLGTKTETEPVRTKSEIEDKAE